MNQANRILVTGATGLIGSHIVMNLLKNAYSVKLLCRELEASKSELRRIFSWYKLNLHDFENQVHWFEGDILNLDAIEDAIDDAQIIIHTAALVSTTKSERDKMLKVNAEGTANLVNVASAKGIKKFIHLSSVATLGPNPEGLVDEDYFFKPDPSTTAYAISKYAAEQEVWRGIEEGLRAVILNPAFVIGPSFRKNSSAGVFYAVADGLPAYVEGSTGYVSVDDIAKACALLINSDINSKRYILCEKNLSNTEFLSRVSKAFNKESPTLKIPKYWFPFIEMAFKIRALFSKRSISVSKDSLKMASSMQRYDGQRIVHQLEGFKYTDIEVKIKETANIVLNNSNLNLI